MQIKHDIHTHTFMSACAHDQQTSAAKMIERAASLGHTIFGISNHMWDCTVAGASTWYRDQSQNFVMTEKPAIDAAEHYGMKILFGVETEYRGMNDILGITAKTGANFDYVLIPHSHTHMRGFVISETEEILDFRKNFSASLKQNYPWMQEKICERLANSLRIEDTDVEFSTDNYTSFVSDFLIESFESLLENTELNKLLEVTKVIIAHPFASTGGKDALLKLDRKRLRRAIIKAAGMNIAFDVNMGTFKYPENGYKDDPMVDFMRLAKECGIKFTFGTDAHTVASLDDIRKGDIIADAIGIDESDFDDIVR